MSSLGRFEPCTVSWLWDASGAQRQLNRGQIGLEVGDRDGRAQVGRGRVQRSHGTLGCGDVRGTRALQLVFDNPAVDIAELQAVALCGEHPFT